MRRVLDWLRGFWGSSRGRWLSIGLTLLALFGVYWFIGSAGKAGEWPRYMDYYDLQAEGFRSGHLYIPVAPNPQLLAQADPYDPVHVKLWFWDVTLYQGRYYMYWGPVPGLLQAAVKTLLGIPRMRMVGDQYLVFAMFSLAALAGALLIERLQRRLLPGVPFWLALLAIFALGMANPAPHLVASGGVYQASIGAAQAFLLWGLVFAFDAVYSGQSGPVRKRYLLLAGGFWALALGSRVSMLLAVGCLTALTAIGCALPRGLKPLRAWWPAARSALLIAIPLAVAMVLLLTYNQLRFDTPFEFGTSLQLSTLKFRVSTDYWLINTYTYLLRPFKEECSFPYAFAPWWLPPKEALAGWIGIPEGYMINEPVVGWLRVVIVTWWLPVALVVGYRKLKQVVASVRAGTPPAASDVGYAYCAMAFTILGTLTAVLLLGLYMATMRYLADVTNGLVLLGTLGGFTVLATRQRRVSRVVVSALCTLTLLATIVFGFLLGYQGYTGHIKQFNPKLEQRMQDWFSTCEAAAAPAPEPDPRSQRRKKR